MECERISCASCLEDVAGSAVTLECQHSFHGVCAAYWFRKNPSCPVCRSLPSESDSESTMDVEAELSTMPRRALSSLLSGPLRAARRCNADPALRQTAQAYRRARAASILASRANRDHRASEPFRTLMRELRVLVDIDVNRRRAVGSRAADLLRVWEGLNAT